MGIVKCGWILIALAGCGDDVCGPGTAPAAGLVATSADVTLTYGDVMSGNNNDCGVMSLTIEGVQVGTTSKVAFCVPDPDALTSGVAFGDGFRFISFYAATNGCTYALPQVTAPTGTARATGFCDGGADPAGHTITLDGSVDLVRTCGAATETIPFQLSGTTAVRPWGT